MNTLNLIRNQIKKQAALHDAQIAVATYRGVRYECQQGSEEIHGTFCYRCHTYNKLYTGEVEHLSFFATI